MSITQKGTPHAGKTVDNVSGTVASDGTLTLYPMHDGLWKYYATSDLSGYQEGIITLEKWGNYSVEFNDTPDGATVTPTDNVQTWLHCVNIWDKSYTTISEVVADTTTLNTLIANENANDYLVRSTTWASDVCSNESAMIYIGLNDYCANKLLADSTWCEAICNSAYFEKVLNVNIPTMTSNTTPSGEVISNLNTGDNDPKYAYYSFNGVYSNDAGLFANFPHILGYKFVNKVIVKRMWVKNRITKPSMFKDFTIEGSDDGTKFTPIKTFVNTNNNSGYEQYFNLYENNKPYLYYRLNITSHYSNFTSFGNIQFYGREEV